MKALNLSTPRLQARTQMRPVQTVGFAYLGRLDLVQLHSRTRAQIDDWKSYFQIVNADTFQSKFYPLLLFCRNPALQKVTFVLEFVRYGTSRKVEYLRSDVAWLKEIAHESGSASDSCMS